MVPATAPHTRLTNRPPTCVFHQGLQSAMNDCSMTVCSFSSPHPFAAHQRSASPTRWARNPSLITDEFIAYAINSRSVPLDRRGSPCSLS